ncbi:MAG: single-stranded DNA-binding protein [Candidatus Kapaibacterium sp.]
MAYLKMPEINHVMIAGNLTKDPVVRKTSNGAPVINFCLASNHRYRDGSNQWAEDVCYVGVVGWNKLADSCMAKLRKGSAVLVDGELQSRTWHENGGQRTVVEVKAHRIQFLNKQEYSEYGISEYGVPQSEDAEAAAPREFAEYAEPHLVEEFEYAEAHVETAAPAYAAGFDDDTARGIFSGDGQTIELRLRTNGGE